MVAHVLGAQEEGCCEKEGMVLPRSRSVLASGLLAEVEALSRAAEKTATVHGQASYECYKESTSSLEGSQGTETVASNPFG